MPPKLPRQDGQLQAVLGRLLSLAVNPFRKFAVRWVVADSVLRDLAPGSLLPAWMIR